jgi:hypothetical protein
MTINQSRTAAFVRGFFSFLESRQVKAAVLYGGDDGFEHDLSDVDFVVSKDAFTKLPNLISAYCYQTDWRLCQVLRHETSAAYFVCSALDDPSCAVALDACSDYQRNGTIFLPAEKMLEDLRPLAWGGYGLSAVNELFYRFSKASAKKKDAIIAAKEFSRYPEEIHRDCAAWLKTQWGISLQSWDEINLTPALARLRKKSNPHPSLTQFGALGRVLTRILRPTGLVVIAGHSDLDAAARLESVFGHLYFRRCKKSASWQPALLKDLVASTLIILPKISALWAKLIPADCIYRLDPTQNIDSQYRGLAKHLNQRCKQRETR